MIGDAPKDYPFAPLLIYTFLMLALAGEHMYVKIDSYGGNLYASVAIFHTMKIDAYGGNLFLP